MTIYEFSYYIKNRSVFNVDFFFNLFLAVLCLLAVRRLSQGREGLISLPCFSLQWLLLLQSTGPSARELQ